MKTNKLQLTNQIFVFTIILSSLILNFAKAQTPVFEVQENATVRTLQEDIMGFNGQNTLELSSTWQTLNSNNINIYNLSPSNLRYPGGTVGNFWDWRKGWFLKKTEFTSNINLPAAYKDRVNSTLGGDKIEHYFESCMRNNCTPLMNLNIMSSDMNYQLGSLYAGSAYGFKKMYIELGNEFYLGATENREVFPNVLDYTHKAIDWAKDLKSPNNSPYSSFKLAVVGAESEENDPGRRRLWIENLLHEVAPINEINAVTLHLYLDSKVGDIASNLLGTSSSSICLNTLSASDANTIFKAGIYNAFKNTNNVVHDEIEQIKNAGKETWITEFNMLNQDKNIAVNGSWFHGLFVTSMAFELMKDESVAKLIPHTLVGNAIFSGLFSDNQGLNYSSESNYSDPYQQACISSTITTNAYERSALGTAISPLCDAIKNSDKLTELNFWDNTQNVGPSALNVLDPNFLDLVGFKLYKVGGGQEFVIMNLSGETNRNLDLSSIINFSNGTVDYNVWYSENPFNYSPGEAVTTTSSTEIITFPKYQLLTTSIIPIPQYSVVHIRVKHNLNIDIPVDVLCCNSNKTYSAPKENWSEGWRWVVDDAGVYFSNPITLTNANFSSTGSKEIFLYDEFGNQVGRSTLSVNPCVPTPEIGLDNNYAISEKEFCPQDPMTVNLTMNPSTLMNSPLSYSYLWVATGQFSTPRATSTDFIPPQSGAEVFAYATDGICWAKSNTIKFISLIPDAQILVKNNNGTPIKIIGDELRLCSNNNDHVSFGAIYNNEDLDLGNSSYVFSENWANCNGSVNISGFSTLGLPNPCELTLTTTVTGLSNPTLVCTTSKSLTLLPVECCSNATASSLVPSGNNSFQNGATELEDELNNYMQNVTSHVTFDNNLNVETMAYEFLATLSPLPIYINGLFLVDADIKLSNYELNMGPNALIKFKGKSKLELQNCRVINCNSDKPWDGIIADEDRQQLIINGTPYTTAPIYKSYIAGSKTAVNLSNDVSYLIANTEFENNRNAISIHDYQRNIPQREGTSGDISGFIFGNKFGSDQVVMNTLYNSSLLTKAIELNNLDRVTIGTKRTADNPNIFSNCDIGSVSSNASVTYWNNDFEHIKRDAQNINLIPYSGAIQSSNTRHYNGSFINIGNSTNPFLARNTFNSCMNSIQIDDEAAVNIISNHFDELLSSQPIDDENANDISINNLSNSVVNIIGNKFRYVNLGVHFYNVLNSNSINIKDNFFNIEQIPSKYGDFTNSAIVFNNPLNNYNTYVNIENNEVNYLRRAVYAAKQDHITIKNNPSISLSYNAPLPSMHPTIGIELKECFNFSVKDNIITKSMYTSGLNEKVTGIKLTNATGGFVGCNNISNTGYSISVSGNCLGTNIRNNDFNMFDAGVFRFSNSLLSQQGDVGDPTDNTWIQPDLSKKRLEGQIGSASIDWYFSGVGSSYDPTISYDFVNFNAIQTIKLISTLNCNSGIPLGLRLNDINSSYNQILGYVDFEEQYNAEKEMYKLLGKDSILVDESVTTSTFLQDLFYDMEISPTKELENVDSLLTLNLDSDILMIIQTIPVSWQSDIYKKQVNSILLKQKDGVKWDALDSCWLNLISNVSINVGGNAVTSACAALKKECHCQGDVFISSRITYRDKNNKDQLFLSPNPVVNEIVVVNKNINDEIIEFEIYDEKGTLIFNKIVAGSNRVKENIDFLKSGAYTVKCKLISNTILTQKFVKL